MKAWVKMRKEMGAKPIVMGGWFPLGAACPRTDRILAFRGVGSCWDVCLTRDLRTLET